MPTRWVYGWFLWCILLILLGSTDLPIRAAEPKQTGKIPPDSGSAQGLPEPFVGEALELLGRFLQIDTSNPPGRELEAAKFLAERLYRAGIESRILQSAPGRANLIARIPGTGKGKAVVLLQHLDVVPAVEEDTGPPAGTLEGGVVWGRGAVDMKGLGITQLMCLLAVKAAGVPPDRDLVLVATADEEMGGKLGADWLLKNHPELVRSVELVLAEGGANCTSEDGALQYVGLELTQKVPVWLRISAHGRPAHGALWMPDSATARLTRVLHRILTWRSPLRASPAVAEYFRRIAPYQSERWQTWFADVETGLKDPVPDVAGLGPYYAALLQNTVNVMQIKTEGPPNILSGVGTALLDCRLQPDRNPESFLWDLQNIVHDAGVQLEVVLRGRPAASLEPARLTRMVDKALKEMGQSSEVGPAVQPGFTDARFFRERGVTAVGFWPFRHAEGGMTHSEGESLEEEDFRFGLELYLRVVARLVGLEPSQLFRTGALEPPSSLSSRR